MRLEKGITPSLKSFGGQTVRSMSVEGKPPGVSPPSRIASISRFNIDTSREVLAGGIPEGLAEVEVMGPAVLVRASARGWGDTRKATFPAGERRGWT